MINITLGGVVVDQIEQPLTKQEVQVILEKANMEVVNGESYSYRLGQAIYNELPDRVAHLINGSDQDMFHTEDADLAVTMLLNLAEKMDMISNIPCHVELLHHNFGSTTSDHYYRTDPTCSDGWVNCDPLGTYFSEEERSHIKYVLTRQGWFRKLFLDDHGEIVTEVVVKSCPVDQWYTKEEK